MATEQEDILAAALILAKLDPTSASDRNWAVGKHSCIQALARRFEAARKSKRCPYNLNLDARCCPGCEEGDRGHFQRAQTEYAAVQSTLKKFEEFFHAVRKTTFRSSPPASA